MNQFKRTIAITGGAGFIGSNLLFYLVPKYNDYLFVNIDCLTYAGNLSNLNTTKDRFNYKFEKIDITDFRLLQDCFGRYNFDGVIHLAAETHVDRSIIGPAPFINTNIMGTFNLLELARAKSNRFRFHHVSTDEVFGSLDVSGKFNETSRYNPTSPYAASKAAGDHLVNAYHKTYGLDVVLTNCSNNFGPFQYPEKLIPLTILKALSGGHIPIYGNGHNIRDWIFVEDHCRALDLVFHRGKSGATYNIGGGNELTTIDMVVRVCRFVDKIRGSGKCEELIRYVEDRPGHDFRYALDSSKIREELEWKPSANFEEALFKTVRWYLENSKWLKENLKDNKN